jgi:hypothetical protein
VTIIDRTASAARTGALSACPSGVRADSFRSKEGPVKGLASGKQAPAGRQARPSAAAPGPTDRAGGLLHLQREAGNRAVAQLVGTHTQRAGGWADADRTGPAYNAGEHVEGTMRRIPIDGLSGGFQGTAADYKTTESAAGRAIAVVPAGLVPGQPVDVLLHLHGYTHRPPSGRFAGDPYPGWRQRGSDHAVRDLALDRIEQQLEATGATQLLGLLPQGGARSDFGKLNPDPYINEALDRLTALGALTARPPLGRVLLSAHSGGGHRIRSLLDAEATPAAKRKGGPAMPSHLGQLMLYDAINTDGELAAAQRWAESRLGDALTALTDPATAPADKDAYLAASPRLVGYYTSGYRPRYTLLGQAIDEWFRRNGAALGGYAALLRSRFTVTPAKGLRHEEIIRGRREADQAGPGTGNLAEAVRAYYRAGQAPAGSTHAGPTHASAAGRDPGVMAAQLTRILGVAPLALIGWLARVGRGADPVTAAVASAAAAGYRDEVELTDMVFAVRHPELGGGRIPDRNDALKQEWRDIRRRVVRPAIRAHPAGTPATQPAPAAHAAPTAHPAPAVAAGRPSPPAARAMTDAQRAKLIEQAVGQATASAPRAKAAAGGKLTKAERAAITAADDMAEEFATRSRTTAEAWFAGIVPDATFLGVPIRKSGGTVSGVHRELLAVLQAAEATLTGRYPGKSPRQLATLLGVYDIAGLRPPKNATGGSRPSMHCYGMAVDINYLGNPFLGQGRRPRKGDKEAKANAQTEMIKRATLLMGGSAFDIGASPKGLGKGGLADNDVGRAIRAERAGQLWEQFHSASEAVRAYLSLSDGDLAARVAVAGQGHDLAWWSQQLAADKALIGHGEFTSHADPSKAGFMDLSKELVEVLVNAGLSWGGCYATGKDLMHFDLRTGTITGRDVL